MNQDTITHYVALAGVIIGIVPMGLFALAIAFPKVSGPIVRRLGL